MLKADLLGGVEFVEFVEEDFFGAGDDLAEGLGRVGVFEVDFCSLKVGDHFRVAEFSSAEIKRETVGEKNSGDERKGHREEVEGEAFKIEWRGESQMSSLKCENLTIMEMKTTTRAAQAAPRIAKNTPSAQGFAWSCFVLK